MNIGRWLPGARAALGPLLKRLDALPARERHAVFAAALAVLAAAEWLLVLPMHERRVNMQKAATEQAQSDSDTASQAQRGRDEAQLALEERLARLDAELARLGAGRTRGEPVGFLLSRTVRGLGVQVLALRELGVEEIDTAPAAEIDPAQDATLAAAARRASPPMYRHRWELGFGGDVAALVACVHRLERELRPLRIEHVRLASRPDGTLEARVGLVVIGTERQWLAL